MKKTAFLFLTVLSLIVSAEPYRPYPVIMVHGYATDLTTKSDWGITILSSQYEDTIENYTTSSIEDGYYISRNEGKRIEYNKLAYKMAELNQNILNLWSEATYTDEGKDSVYWIKNDIGLYNQIPSAEAILPEYLGDTMVDRPINCFLETMEFDYPPNGSSNQEMVDKIKPFVPQIGRGIELLCKLKETLINYYTEGKAIYQKKQITGSLDWYAYDVYIQYPGQNPRALIESDLKGDAKVIFIAHSFGGVNLRQMLLDINSRGETYLYSHIERIITVDTPHLGSPPANQNDALTYDSSWWWLYNRIYWLNGYDVIFTSTPYSLFSGIIRDIAEEMKVPENAVDFWEGGFSLMTQIVDFAQEYCWIRSDACYDLEPHNREGERYNYIADLMSEEHLKIENNVDYAVHYCTSSNTGIRTTTEELYIGSMSILLCAIATHAVWQDYIGVALYCIEFMTGAASYITWDNWLCTSDVVVPVESQNPFIYFNEVLRKFPDERFNVVRQEYTNNAAHMKILSQACFDRNESLIKLFERKPVSDIFAMTYQDKYENLDINSTFYDVVNCLYNITTVPETIYSIADKYFICQGNNKLKINNFVFNFEYGNNEIGKLNIDYGTFDNSKVKIYGDINEYFRKGKNHIELITTNICDEQASTGVDFYIAGGPQIVTENPEDNEIVIDCNNSEVNYKSQITFEENATKLTLDELKTYIIKLPISTLEQEIDSISKYDVGNNTRTYPDELTIENIEDGRYEIYRVGYYIQNEPPVQSYSVFYVDTTAPIVNLENYNNMLNKYSLREDGCAKFVIHPDDNMSYFFPYFENGALRIEKNGVLQAQASIESATFGGVSYSKWEVSNYADFKDTVYSAIVRLRDKAGHFSEDTVEFEIDNTPPAINIVSGFTDNVFNMYDISSELTITVNEKCEGRVVFENGNGQENSNPFDADTISYNYFVNDNNELDSTESNIKTLNVGSWGNGIYLPDGQYQVLMNGWDEVGNDTTYTIESNYIVDRTPPIITNPVCLPLVVSDDNISTLTFKLSELNDALINRGEVTYNIMLGDNELESEKVIESDGITITTINVELDLSEAPNGINTITIKATDIHGNESYAYAQVIKKSIGTYITKPTDNNTMYLGIPNAIEGIANDPDMSNDTPFEKYALYYKEGETTDIPQIRSDILDWDISNMYTPIGYRDMNLLQNESSIFTEYPKLLGYFNPESEGLYTLLLASFEEGKDEISVHSRIVNVILDNSLKLPEITDMVTKNQLGTDSRSFNFEDTLLLDYNINGRISDVRLEIENGDSLIYSSEKKSLYPLSKLPSEYIEEGFYVCKIAGDRYAVRIYTPNDTLYKSVSISSESGIDLISTDIEGVTINNNELTYSGKDTTGDIVFSTTDSLVNFNFSPDYINVYGGKGVADLPRAFTYNTNNQFKWGFKDKFLRNISGGNYTINLSAVGSDGIGLDTAMGIITYSNPLSFVSCDISPDTINVFDPTYDRITVSLEANQRSFTKYSVVQYDDNTVLNTFISDLETVDWELKDDFSYSAIDVATDSLFVTVKLIDQDIKDSIIKERKIYTKNKNVPTFAEGIDIPGNYLSGIKSANIFDGKGEYLYSFTASGENYLDREFILEDSLYALKLMNYDISIVLLRHLENYVNFTEFSEIYSGGSKDDLFLTRFYEITQVTPNLTWASFNINDVEVDDKSVVKIVVTYIDNIGTDFTKDADTNIYERINDNVSLYDSSMTINSDGDPDPDPDYKEDVRYINLNYLLQKEFTGAYLTWDEGGGFVRFYKDSYSNSIHQDFNINIPNVTIVAVALQKDYIINVNKQEFNQQIISSSPMTEMSNIFTSPTAVKKYEVKVDSIRFKLEFFDDTIIKTIANTESNTYFSDYNDLSLPNSSNQELLLNFYIDTLVGNKFYHRIKNIAAAYSEKYSNSYTLKYIPSRESYEELMYNLTTSNSIPLNNQISYDFLYGYHFINIEGDDDIYSFLPNLKEFDGDKLAINQDIYASAKRGFGWNTVRSPEAVSPGKVISKFPLEFSYNTDFPDGGNETFNISTNYPSEVLNINSIFLRDVTDVLISNERLRLDEVDMKILNPNTQYNPDIILNSVHLSGITGMNDFKTEIKNALRAKPQMYMPIVGNIFPGTSIAERLKYRYEIYVRNNDKIDLIKEKTTLKPYGDVLYYLNTEKLYGATEIIVPIYYSYEDIPIQTILWDDSETDSLVCVFKKDIIIGNEFIYDGSDPVSLGLPYKRGYVSFTGSDGITDIAKAMLHIAPEMIVDNGEEPYITESFCPVIELYSEKGSINKPIVSYTLTTDELNNIEPEKIKFYGINESGDLVKFTTTIITAGSNRQFIIDATEYNNQTIMANNIDKMKYFTLLDSTQTDERKLENIIVNKVSKKGVELKILNNDKQDFFARGKGILITDPIENIYEAVCKLQTKPVLTLFDAKAVCDSVRLIFDIFNPEFIKEETDSYIVVFIPSDSLFKGYNRLFIGNGNSFKYGVGEGINNSISFIDSMYQNLCRTDSLNTMKNTVVSEIEFNYQIPEVLQWDSIVTIGNYVGENIAVILSDSTNALINISDSNGSIIYNGSISSLEGDSSFFWNGNLVKGQSDKGEYRFEIIPFLNNGLLGESVSGRIIINRHPDIEIIQPSADTYWYNNNINLLAENKTNSYAYVNWYMDFGIGEVDLTSSQSGDTVNYNTRTSPSGKDIYIIAKSRDIYTNEGIDSVIIGIDNENPEIVNISGGVLQKTVGDTIIIYNDNNTEMEFYDGLSGVGKVFKIVGPDTTEIILGHDLDVYFLNTNAEITVYDKVGNSSNKYFKFITDNAEPIVTVNVGEPSECVNGVYYITGTTPLKIKAQDEMTSVVLSKFKWGFTETWVEFTDSIVIYNEYEGKSEEMLYIYAVDELGNYVNYNQLFRFDNTPPVTSIWFEMPWYNDGEQDYLGMLGRIVLSATDDLSGVKSLTYNFDFEEDVSSLGSQISLEVQNLPNGLHNINYFAADNAGNIEDEITDEFYVDLISPVTTWNVDKDLYVSDGYFISGRSLIYLSSSDIGSGVQSSKYKLHDMEVYSPFNLFMEGLNIIEFNATDNVGNTEENNLLNIYLDLTPPVTDIEFDGIIFDRGDFWVISMQTEIQITAVDNISGVKETNYAIDDVANVSVGDKITNIVGGEHDVFIKAKDNVNNESGWNVYRIIVDNTGPLTDIQVSDPKYLDYITSESTISITASDDYSGVKEIKYSINGVNYLYNGPFSISGMDGDYQIEYWAVDSCNNLSEIKNLALKLDNTPPSIAINYNMPQYKGIDYQFVTSEASIDVTAVDLGCGVKESRYDIGGAITGEFTETANIPLLGLAESIYRISVQTEDNIGNENSKNEEFVIDNSSPTTVMNIGEPKYQKIDTMLVTSVTLITLTSTDNPTTTPCSGVREIHYGYATENITGSAAVTDNILGSDGAYLYKYFAIDNLSNLENAKTVLFELDNTAPQVRITYPYSGIFVNQPVNVMGFAEDKNFYRWKLEYRNKESAEWVEITGWQTSIAMSLAPSAVSKEKQEAMSRGPWAKESSELRVNSLELKENTGELVSWYAGGEKEAVSLAPGAKESSESKEYAGELVSWYAGGAKESSELIVNSLELEEEGMLGVFRADEVADGEYVIRLTAQDLVYNTGITEIEVKVGEPVRDLELTGYLKPEGVWAGDYIYIADSQHKRIVKTNEENELLMEIREFQPSDVFVDNSGTIYATDQDSRVYAYNTDGAELFNIEGHLHPKGIEVRNNLIYVADTYRNRIVIYNMSGEVLREINSVKHPEGIAVDDAGNIFTCIDESNEIRGYNKDGEEIFRYGVVGHDAGEFVRAVDIDVDSKGYLWVADRNNNRVHMIDWVRGCDLLLIGSTGHRNKPTDGMNKPEGLSIVEENGMPRYVYIADTNNDRIIRYDLNEVYTDQKARMMAGEGDALEIEQFLPFPNPTSSVSNIRIVLNKAADLTVNIYTVTGKLVYREETAGTEGINQIMWNGMNAEGKEVLNGVYNIQVVAETTTGERAEKWSKIAIIK